VRADLHTHSTLSDGTDSPAELVTKAVDAGLDVVALTDHDTYAGLDEARRRAEELGIGFVPGIEISCRLGGVSVHLLGYGAGPEPALDAELARARVSRADRLPDMLDRLAAFGMPLTRDEVMRWVGDSPSVGRPHVADAMVARGYVASRDEAFRDWLAEGSPVYVDRYAIDLPRAVALVLAAGGAPVIAHPWSRQSRAVLTIDVLARLASAGLTGIEVDHPDHDAGTRAELRTVAASLGLLATGSSDYHGLGKVNNDLGCETTSEPVLAALQARIASRRAC
jgi:predicted metal-dependent phosphoesterase TrpH